MQQKPKHIRFTPLVKEWVEHGIQEDLSPEQIVGLAKIQVLPCVSHERIYQHIWEEKSMMENFTNICVHKENGIINGVTKKTEEELFPIELILNSVRLLLMKNKGLVIWKLIR